MKHIIWFFVGIFLVPFSIYAQKETKIVDDSCKAGDNFGYSVTISGNYAAVGVPYSDNEYMGVKNHDQGSVIFYEYDDSVWVKNTHFYPPINADSILLGYKVDIDGEYAIVTVPWLDISGEKSGAAYIFHLEDGQWVYQTALIPSDGSEDDRFGISAKISGEYAIIGAFFDDVYGNRSGSAYIFKREGNYWHQVTKLVPDDGEEGDWYGVKVEIQDSIAAVGSRYNSNEGGNRAGAVYFYNLEDGNWVFKKKYTPPEGSGYVRFEAPIISDKYVIIGSCFDHTVSSFGGCVYIANNNSGTFSDFEKLKSDSIGMSEHYGQAIGLDGDILIVGAPYAKDTGGIFIYNLNDLSIETQLISPQADSGDVFGGCIDFDGKFAIVSAYKDDSLGIDAGAVYFYEFSMVTSTEPIEELGGDLSFPNSYPNPFDESIKISYVLTENTPVTVQIFDVKGQIQATLINNSIQKKGEYIVEWDCKNENGTIVSPGIYFCRVSMPSHTHSIKLIKNY